jgi:hypothetical protein
MFASSAPLFVLLASTGGFSFHTQGFFVMYSLDEMRKESPFSTILRKPCPLVTPQRYTGFSLLTPTINGHIGCGHTSSFLSKETSSDRSAGDVPLQNGTES